MKSDRFSMFQLDGYRIRLWSKPQSFLARLIREEMRPYVVKELLNDTIRMAINEHDLRQLVDKGIIRPRGIIESGNYTPWYVASQMSIASDALYNGVICLLDDPDDPSTVYIMPDFPTPEITAAFHEVITQRLGGEFYPIPRSETFTPRSSSITPEEDYALRRLMRERYHTWKRVGVDGESFSLGMLDTWEEGVRFLLHSPQWVPDTLTKARFFGEHSPQSYVGPLSEDLNQRSMRCVPQVHLSRNGPAASEGGTPDNLHAAISHAQQVMENLLRDKDLAYSIQAEIAPLFDEVTWDDLTHTDEAQLLREMG